MTIEVLKRLIVQNKLPRHSPEEMLLAWHNIIGIYKKKGNKDAVAYQRSMRKERKIDFCK